MRALGLATALCLALTLGGCGKPQSTAPEQPPGAPPAMASLPGTGAPAPAPATPQAASPDAATAAAKVVRTNEDGSELVEDTTGDSGTHNPLLAAVASTVAAGTATATAAPMASPTTWQEGKNYTRLVPAQPTAVPTGQVEVLEFFWYACPHCYAIDPLVESWKKSKAGYITFSRVPVMWNEGHRSLARLYYTLEILGKLDQVHEDIFKEIQVSGDPLVAADPNNTAESERMQTAFAKKLGISEDTFKKTYRSFAVETDLQRADSLVQRYRVDGVPTFVVNGKYVADVRSADGADRLMSLVSDLAAQEHKL